MSPRQKSMRIVQKWNSNEDKSMMRTGILELWTIQGLNQSLAEGIRFHLKDRKNLNSRVLPHPGSGHFQVKNGRSFDVSLTLCKVDSVLIINFQIGYQIVIWDSQIRAWYVSYITANKSGEYVLQEEPEPENMGRYVHKITQVFERPVETRKSGERTPRPNSLVLDSLEGSGFVAIRKLIFDR